MSPLTNLGLYGDFSFCDKDIIAGLNANFQLLDNLVQLAFTNFANELPADPNMGDKYILSTTKTINLWNGSEWITYPAQEGYIGFNKDDNLIYFFDGVDWTSFPASAIFFDNTGTDLLATNLQDAVVELKTLNDTTNTNLTTGLDGKADLEHTHPLSDLTQSGANPNDIAVWNGTTWVPQSQSGLRIVNTYGGTIALTAANDVVSLVAGSFDVTLPSASGLAGKIFEIIHSGSSLTNVFTIIPDGVELIGNQTSFSLYTNGETLKIVSNGFNWLILDHFAETPWVDAGPVTITSTGTNPVKASSSSIDKIYWQRKGQNASVNVQYRQNANTGASAGTGGYIINMPSGLIIDTAITGATTGGNLSDIEIVFGTATVGHNSTKRPSIPLVYSSSGFTLWTVDSSSNFIRVGSGHFRINETTGVTYLANLTVPIEGWQP